ncbi:MAG: transglycosylase domain-containing protein [Burkholderiaceae bacterium]
MHADPADDPRLRRTRFEPASSPWPRRLLIGFCGSLLLVALAAGGLYAWISAVSPTTPSRADLEEVKNVRPSVLMSADGVELSVFKRVRQERLPLAQISPNVVAALIATEDHRFREHRGVDWRRTVASVFHTLRGDPQGGSTITQQLARNLFPEEIGRERSIDRKLREIITALRIERIYSKDEILKTYLNTADFLYNAVGIEAAARTYFDKPASALDVAEAATLVGMLKGTSYYNPVQHPDRAKARRNVVLSQLVKHGALPAERYAALRDTDLAVRTTREPESLGSAPHFALYARKWLAEWAEKNGHDLYHDGLTIVTTLDTRLQTLASQAVERQATRLQQVVDVEWSQPTLRVVSASTDPYVKAHAKADPFGHLWAQRRDLVTAFIRDSAEFRKLVADKVTEPAALEKLLGDADFMRKLRADKTRLEAGFVAMDPANGDIKAWVGSRDFDLGQYDHVQQAERQPGSTFKPFVYGAALEAGIDPDKTYVDGSVEIALGNGKVWKPTDVTGATGNPMSLRNGLIYSKNTITAQVMQEVGPARVVALAKAMGVDHSKLDPVPALALGTSDVTLLEMVNGYATIAREGQVHEPVFIKRIVDRQGKTIAEFGGATRRAMSADAANDLVDMLRGVVARGTGTQIRTRFGITADVAGKTGTTQNNTDGWFILMHPQLVSGAWVGFNDARVTMRSDYWGQGGHNAILLVGDFVKAALAAQQIDAKAKFPLPRHPAPPPMPAAPAVAPTLPPTGPAGWDSGLPLDELAAGRPDGALPSAAVTAPRARYNGFERSGAAARAEEGAADRPTAPGWQRAIPVQRPRAAPDPDAVGFEIETPRRDGAELLRDAPDARSEFGRRQRWRAPSTRSSFDIEPAVPAWRRGSD